MNISEEIEICKDADLDDGVEGKVLFERFEIIYDHFPAVVKSDGHQYLSGKLVLNTFSHLNLRGLYVTCKGDALVGFNDEDDENPERLWTANRTYMDTTQILWGNEPGSKAYFLTLQTGNYSFPFQFKIPAGLPPSFEGDYGYIRYYCKAIIDKPWEGKNEIRLAAFNVMSNYDLNSLPSSIVATPCEARDVRIANTGGFCGLCESKGEVSVYMKTDRKGYVPGEQIIFDINIRNKSNQELTKWEIRLLQRTIYLAHKPGDNKIRKTACILSFSHGSDSRLKAGGTLSIENEGLTVPPLPPSALHECDIIEIEYALKFEGYLNMVEEKFRAVIPLTIGTIPLASQWDRLKELYNVSERIRANDRIQTWGAVKTCTTCGSSLCENEENARNPEEVHTAPIAAGPAPLLRKSNRSCLAFPVSKIETKDPDHEAITTCFFGHRPHYAFYLYD